MADAMTGWLHAPKRNKYFYGKLLDVSHMQLEQCYGIETRRLLNRLALGPGVLCGLGVTAGSDGTLCISPGVAIDGCGREIVVPAAYPSVDPAQPTDDLGLPAGDKLTGGQTTIYLCYTECDTDRTEVYVSECDGVPTTAPSTTVEKYRVIVRPGVPAEPGALTAAQRDAIFPPSPAADFDRRVTAEETLAITCAAPPECCVVLATVTLPASEQPLTVDQCTYRAEVFSNTVLFELIAALADRVDACCAAMHLVEYITVTDGDNQAAAPGQVLPAPVTLLVRDAEGAPAVGAAVTVSTADPDGALSQDNVVFAATINATSAVDGTASVFWQLGSTPGNQTLAATLAGGASATASATAATAPVVQRIDPPNAAATSGWFEKPELAITFDQEMDPVSLANPGPWLRAWFFQDNVDNQPLVGSRMMLFGGEPRAGTTVAFPCDFRGSDASHFTVIVVMRGGLNIVAKTSRLALDAEYRGTQLTDQQLDELWDSYPFQTDDPFSAAVIDSGNKLPSGDGEAGGQYFHSFFQPFLA